MSERTRFVELLPSAARSSNEDLGLTNDGYKALEVLINVSADPGTDTMDVKIQGKDPISGTAYDISTAALSIASTGLYRMLVVPDFAATPATPVKSDQFEQDVLTRNLNVNIVHTGTDTLTYSVAAVFITG